MVVNKPLDKHRTTMASLATEQKDASTVSTQSPAAREIASCRSRCSLALGLIRKCKTQPTEMSAGSQDLLAVMKVLTTAANNLDMISTKFTITVDACCQQADSGAWAAALCKSVDNSLEGVVSSGTVASACSCGRHLRHDLLFSLETVVVCLEKQLQVAEQRLSDSMDSSLRNQLVIQTGQVSSACKNITLLPNSNKGCLKRRILKCFKQTKDVLNEIEEMINDSVDSPRIDEDDVVVGGEAEGKDDDLNFPDGVDFFDDYDFSLSSKEIVTSRKCFTFVTCCSDFMKSVALIVGKHVSDRACSQEAVDGIDQMVDAMTQFCAELNELGVCLCPPQTESNVIDVMVELKKMAEQMNKRVEEILNVALSEKSNEAERLELIKKVQLQVEVMRGM